MRVGGPAGGTGVEGPCGRSDEGTWGEGKNAGQRRGSGWGAPPGFGEPGLPECWVGSAWPEGQDFSTSELRLLKSALDLEENMRGMLLGGWGSGISVDLGLLDRIPSLFPAVHSPHPPPLSLGGRPLEFLVAENSVRETVLDRLNH